MKINRNVLKTVKCFGPIQRTKKDIKKPISLNILGLRHGLINP